MEFENGSRRWLQDSGARHSLAYTPALSTFECIYLAVVLVLYV
jgi:hypothetical protein